MKILMRKNNVVMFLLIVLILSYFIRVLYLDSDLHAPWGVLTYQPIDEGTYANLALNKINFGVINPNDVLPNGLTAFIQPHVITNVVGNLCTYLSMNFLGDNFYGFKMGSVIIGFIIVLLYYFTMKDLSKKYSISVNAHAVIFGFLALLIFSFVFFNASRLVEPTLYRLLFAQIAMYIMLRETWAIKVKYFFLCFTITISIFLVYITNLYLALSVIFLFLYFLFNKEKAQAITLFKYGLLGVVAAYLISFVYYQVFWSTEPFKNMIEGMSAFQYSSYYEITSSSFLINFYGFLSNNIFLYAIPIIMFCIMYLYDLVKYAIHKKDFVILFLLFQIIGLLVQTICSYDFITRKALVIFPSILYITFIIYQLLIQGVFEKRKRPLSLICSIFFAVLIFSYRIYFIKDGTNLDFSEKDKVLLLTSCCISVLLILLIYKSPPLCRLKVLLAIGGMSMIAINGMFILKYNIMNPTYETKNMMIEIGNVANDEFVLGEYQNGFTLYNNIKPILNTQDKINEFMKNGNYYYFDFSEYASFDDDPDSLNQNVEIVETFQHNFKGLGQFRSLSLFKYKK